MSEFLSEYKLRVVGDAAVAGTDAIASDVIDTAGAVSAVFFATIATANAGNYIKVQQDTAVGMGAAADLLGTKVVAANNGEVVAVEITQPAERYLKAIITRGSSTATGEIYCLLEMKKQPAVNTLANEIISEVHATPAEGTA